MTPVTDEFIPLPHPRAAKGLHRIRHYGLFAKNARANNIARARELLAVSKSASEPPNAAADPSKPTCPCCGGRMVIIEVFARGANVRINIPVALRKFLFCEIFSLIICVGKCLKSGCGAEISYSSVASGSLEAGISLQNSLLAGNVAGDRCDQHCIARQGTSPALTSRR
jgi:hypothetical protein